MKYYGKEKCRILKEIRAEIARQNDIEWVTSECKHKGNCKGTCPKCEAEVRELEAALAHREALGKTVAVVGISAALSLAVTGCDPHTATVDGIYPATEGGAPLPPETEMSDGQYDPEAAQTEISDGEYLVPDTETSTENVEELPIPGEAPQPPEKEPVMGEPAL
jgi:hypothetical protein